MMDHRAVSQDLSPIARARRAASASRLVRSVLVAMLAVGVTVGGVVAGALVVAPVVAQATRPDAAARATRLIAGIGTTAVTASRAVVARASEVGSTTIAQLPAPAARFALPGLALVAIVGALSTLFLRRRTPARSLTPAPALNRNDLRLTPRASNRTTGKRQQTPRAVEALAATGATTSDIAWKTGLPIDAVQLLLSISTGARQLQPPAA